MGNAFGPMLLLAFVLAVDLWIYLDARQQAARGTPVILSSNVLRIDSPEGWFLSCLVLWILFVPLYLAGRNRFA